MVLFSLEQKHYFVLKACMDKLYVPFVSTVHYNCGWKIHLITSHLNAQCLSSLLNSTCKTHMFQHCQSCTVGFYSQSPQFFCHVRWLRTAAFFREAPLRPSNATVTSGLLEIPLHRFNKYNLLFQTTTLCSPWRLFNLRETTNFRVGAKVSSGIICTTYKLLDHREKKTIPSYKAWINALFDSVALLGHVCTELSYKRRDAIHFKN